MTINLLYHKTIVPTLTVWTHWGRDKMADISRRHFQVHFLEWKCLNFDCNFTDYVHKIPPGDKPLSEPMMARLLMHICVTRPQWVNQNVSKHRSFYYFFYQVSSLFVWTVWFKLLHCHINVNLGYIPHIEMANSTKEIFCTKFLQGPFY